MADKENYKSVVKNTSMLYILNITKIALPLLTLPYLTRVLSKDCYGVVSYVKAVMQYMQIIIDFGFLLSATKDIVNVRDNKDAINKVVGDTMLAKLILLVASLLSLIILIILMPILRSNVLFTLLSFAVVGMTCFLMDFLFRGLEEMHVITIRFVIMRLIATALTFVFVKNDSDVLWIPCLDIIGSLVAVIFVFREMKKRDISIKITSLKNAVSKLKESAMYFISNMATTAFTAFNTLVIGFVLSEQQIAEWSICMQMITAVQSMYTPVTNGIFPYMVKSRDWNLIRKTLKIYMPIISLGCVFTFFAAKYALLIIGGQKYTSAESLLRAFIPLLFFSFPAMLYGWPALGAIGKTKETTQTTLLTAGMQVLGVAVLLLTGYFNVLSLAILRGSTEIILFGMRYGYCRKYKKEFINV